MATKTDTLGEESSWSMQIENKADRLLTLLVLAHKQWGTASLTLIGKDYTGNTRVHLARMLPDEMRELAKNLLSAANVAEGTENG